MRKSIFIIAISLLFVTGIAKADVIINGGNNQIVESLEQFGAFSTLKAWQILVDIGLIRPYETTDVVVIGDTSTTSPDSIFEVKGLSYFRGAVYSTSTVTSTASIHAPEFCINNDCQTTWPSGGGTNLFDQWLDSTNTPQFAGAMLTASTTINANATTTGHIASLGGNSDQWNEAYSWGNHASQNYLDLDTYPNADTDSTDDWDTTSEQSFWNGTSTWAGFQSEWNKYTNASSTMVTEADFDGLADTWESGQTARTADDLSDNTTADLAENTNLYYTDNRVRDYIQASSTIQTHFTNADTAYSWGDWSGQGFITDLSGFDTDDLSEGTNLYYTQARVWDDTWASTTLAVILQNAQTSYLWGNHADANYLDLDTYPNADTDYTDDFSGSWDDLTSKPATNTVLALIVSDYRVPTLNATSSVIDTLWNKSATSTVSIDSAQYCINGADCITSWSDISGTTNWDELTNKPATSTILALLDSDYRILHLNATTSLIDQATSTNLVTGDFTATGALNLPASGISDAMVSDTLTASDLVAGSSVVANSEVDDDLTISGGTIENTPIGASTQSTAKFTYATTTASMDALEYCINGADCITAWSEITGAADWDALTNKPATSTILALLDSDYRILHLNATSTLTDKATTTYLAVTDLTATGDVNLPADSITDAMVSNTLTASDLQAGSEVVADSEVVDALTINTSIEGIFSGNLRSNLINASSTLFDHSTTTGAVYMTNYDCSGNANGGALTVDANGLLACSDDDSGAGGGDFAWTATDYGVATSTTIGLLNGFLSTASSTIVADFRIDGNATSTGSFSAGQLLVGDTPLSISNWDAAYAGLHNAITVTGQDYLTLSTQEITVGEIQPDDLAASDFGDFTCDGDTCTLDLSYLTDITGSYLGQLANVATSSTAIGDILMWDGLNWINQATSSILMASELDTFSELNALVADATLLKGGTLTDTKYCVWNDGAGQMDCNAEAGVGGAAWDELALNVLTPTNTSAGIFVNASSTIDGDFTVIGNGLIQGNATSTGHIAGIEFIQNGTSLADIYSPIAGSASIVTVGTLTTGATGAGFTVNLDTSTLTCTNCIDISGNTNLTAGDHITLTNDDLDIDDDFVLNTTDTMTGGLTMHSATTTDTFNVGNYIQYTLAGDNYLYFDNAKVEYLMWDDSPGEFVVTDDLNILGNASTTALNINSNFRVDGDGNATSTSSFVVGTDGASNTRKGCMAIMDTDLGGWTYCYTLDGAMTCGTTDCSDTGANATSTLIIGQ